MPLMEFLPEGVGHVLNSSLNKTQKTSFDDTKKHGKTKLLYVARKFGKKKKS